MYVLTGRVVYSSGDTQFAEIKLYIVYNTLYTSWVKYIVYTYYIYHNVSNIIIVTASGILEFII